MVRKRRKCLKERKMRTRKDNRWPLPTSSNWQWLPGAGRAKTNSVWENCGWGCLGKWRTL